MRHFAAIGLGALICTLAPVSIVRAAFIPYPTPGVENPVIYAFTALSTGHIVAYFAGSTAGFENVIGLSVNGGAVASFGLDNHDPVNVPYGTSFDMGLVNAGDSLVFVMHNIVPGIGNLYSDASLNQPYDSTYDPQATAHNHIYSTAFVTDGIIPTGTFVAFEDLPPVNPFFTEDFNYNDEDFVFTNVASQSTTVPIPAAIWGGIALMGGLITRRGLRRRPA